MTDTILNYALKSCIFQDGYYDLWEAENNLGLKAIIKKTKPSFAGHPGVYKFFREEAVSLAKVHHPYVIRMLGFDDTGGMPSLVVESFDLPTVRKQIHNHGPMKEEVACQFVLKVLDAAYSVLSHGISHFRITSENICIDTKNNPLITSLGLSIEEVLGFAPRLKDEQLENLVYRSPESLMGTSQNIGQDVIYGAGVLLFLMLRGRLPVEVRNLNTDEAYAQIVNHNWQKLLNITPRTQAWMDKLTHINPTERFGNIREAIQYYNNLTTATPKSTAVPVKVNAETQLINCINPLCDNTIAAGRSFCGKCGTNQNQTKSK